MAQHDYVIDNASGASVRADINSALAAIKSTNSGAAAPSAPAAGMLWLDTDTPSATEWTLFIYDGTDWITVGTVNATTNIFTPSATTTGAALIRAADAAAARTAIGATATGSSLITAASAAAARTTLGATTVGGNLFTAATAAAARTTLGSTTVGDAVFIAADAAAARTAIGAPPNPTASAGVGQWTAISNVLPAGGTWAWFVAGITSGAVVSHNAGVSAGGSTVATGATSYIGFAWRIA